MKSPHTKKPYTKMTATELAAATAQYDQPVDLKKARRLSDAQWRRFKAVKRGPGRPRIGRGAVNVLVSLEIGLLERLDAMAKSQGIGRSKLLTFALESYLAQEPMRRRASA
jgi:hypothetical protein